MGNKYGYKVCYRELGKNKSGKRISDFLRHFCEFYISEYIPQF